MIIAQNVKQLLSEDFEKPGLYLIFEDEDPLALTRENIDRIVTTYLNDSNLLPDSVKKAVEFAPCSICPERDTAKICHAILPILPFVEKTDQFYSHETVTAVYRAAEAMPLQIVDTTMQQALMFVAILSLTEYCETGLQFKQYFRGINPLMPADQIANTMFKNIYLDYQGDLEAISSLVQEMSSSFTTTSSCQIERLQLISRRDAFCNAFVNTQNTSAWLMMMIEDHIEDLKKGKSVDASPNPDRTPEAGSDT